MILETFSYLIKSSAILKPMGENAGAHINTYQKMADKPVIKLRNYVPEDKNNFVHERVNPSAAKDDDDDIQVL